MASFVDRINNSAPWLVVIIIFIGAMAFLVIPQLKRLNLHMRMLNALVVGDRVVTNGGLIGYLTNVDGQFLHISFSQLEPIPILRSAIERVLPLESDSKLSDGF